VSATANSGRRRLVHADVGGLRGQHDGDQQSVEIGVDKFALRMRLGRLEALENRRDAGRLGGFRPAAPRFWIAL